MLGLFSGGEGGNAPPVVKPMKEGWLKKEGANVKSWKVRFFKLYPNRLEYYKKMPITGIMSLQGTIAFDTASTVAVLSEERAGNRFIFSVTLPKREYYISADSEKDRQEWIQAITAALRSFKGAKAPQSSTKELGNVTDVSYPDVPKGKDPRDRRDTSGFSLSSSQPRESPLIRQLSQSGGGFNNPTAGDDSDRASRRRSSLFTEPPVPTTREASKTVSVVGGVSTPEGGTTSAPTSKNGEGGGEGTGVRTRPYSSTSAERPKGRLINIEVDLKQVSTGEVTHDADAKQNSTKYSSDSKNGGVGVGIGVGGKGRIERIPYTAYSKDKGFKSTSNPALEVTHSDPTYPTSSAPSRFGAKGRDEEASRLLPGSGEQAGCQCCTVM